MTSHILVESLDQLLNKKDARIEKLTNDVISRDLTIGELQHRIKELEEQIKDLDDRCGPTLLEEFGL